MTRVCTPADSLLHWTPYSADPSSVFPAARVRAELLSVRKAMGLPEHPILDDEMEDEEWAEIIGDLPDHLGVVFDRDVCAVWGQSATDRMKHAIAVSVGKALNALKEAEKCEDEHGSPTGVLLPISFARRFDLLVGRQALPVVWVRRLDVLQF